MDLAISGISDIFHSAFGADKGVVAFSIRRVVTLHISRLCAVIQLHHDHIVIFHVDFRRESLDFQRGEVVFIPGGTSRFISRAAGAFVIDAQHSHTDHPPGY